PSGRSYVYPGVTCVRPRLPWQSRAERRIEMSTSGMTTTTTLPERSDAPDAPDAAVIEAAWREFTGELRTFIRRRVSRPDDADDILQLVALRLTQNQSLALRLTQNEAAD